MLFCDENTNAELNESHSVFLFLFLLLEIHKQQSVLLHANSLLGMNCAAWINLFCDRRRTLLCVVLSAVSCFWLKAAWWINDLQNVLLLTALF